MVPVIITSILFGALSIGGLWYISNEGKNRQCALVVNHLLTPQQRQLLPFLSENTKVIHAEVTAYDAQSPRSINLPKWRDGRTSLNRPAVPGKTVAVDPAVIPYDSLVFIPDVGWRVAEDTGSKIKGNKIDLLMPNERKALQFGRKTTMVLWVSKK